MLRQSLVIVLAVLACAAVPGVAAAAVQAGGADPSAQALGVALSAIGAVATTAILGAVKRTDYALFQKPAFKKVQPVLTLAGALAAPYVASWASSGVDISGFGQAPVMTIGAVVLAEFAAMLKRSL